MLAEVLHKKLYLKNNKMKFIDLWSEFTPKYVPNRVIYKLNDISEAGASVISDIILDYVKLPLEGDYTTQNKKIKKTYQKFNINPRSEVQHQPRVQRINNNQKFPNHLNKIYSWQYLIIDISSKYYFCMIHIQHVLCLHVANILIHNLSITKSPVSILSASKRGVPNRDLFNIIV
jgi:hypothetical protein